MLCAFYSASEARNNVESVRATIASGQTIRLPETFVRTDVILKADIRTRRFEKISLGLGENCYCGGGIVVTPDEYVFFDRRRWGKSLHHADTVNVSKTEWNEGPVGQHLSITIISGHGSANLELKSRFNTYKGVISGWWEGGTPFLTNNGDAPMTVTLSFERMKESEPIWFYADSYFSTLDKARWPCYMQQEGLHNWMADHIPGGDSKGLLQAFKHDLEFGRPEIAVWMLGMNDGSDTDGKPCSVWLECVQEFIDICQENGIIPVLTTIPTVPKRFHDCKTEWVRQSRCRYIDWYEASGTDSHGNWNEGYLQNDGVHPTDIGAKALYLAVKKSLPELSPIH